MNKGKQKTTASVVALKTLLEELTQRKGEVWEKYAAGMLPFLASQGALARYTNYELEINDCSLNTLKRISDDCIEGGFQALDQLRRTALALLNRQRVNGAQPSRSSKASLQEKIDKSDEIIKQLRGDLLLLTLVLEKSLDQGRTYASEGSELLRIRCKKEQRELLETLTLRKTQKIAEVVKLHDY